MYKGSSARLFSIILAICCFTGCKKSSSPAPVTPASALQYIKASFDGITPSPSTTFNVKSAPLIRFYFNNSVDRSSVASSVLLTENGSTAVPVTVSYESNDSVLVVQPATRLKYLTRYNITTGSTLKSVARGNLLSGVDLAFVSQLDSSNKFTLISDNALMDTVQKRTFAYFWDFAHPVSGLARERNTSGEVVTSGGSGFGIMAIPVAVSRNFITRAQGLSRMQTIVGFLKNTAQTFHGAFPHWINGTTGAAVPFSTKDNGADLVETSYLMMGLLTARQYFNGGDAAETALRNDINMLWRAVDWNWFRQGSQNVLYWHWSPDYDWQMNVAIRGWNECLVTYVLAASSTTHGIPPAVYTNGWANNGGSGFINGSTYYGYTLPLGPALGGPLFLSQYSFMGINPNGLSDAYANYTVQTKNHTLINYGYCRANPAGKYGYSSSCWGLTASDVPNGYAASSPANDVGVIAPTAALSSMPYTPAESMQALKFFYYILGDKIWGQYGFTDAFSLQQLWFANSYLAIDQGPVIVMMENHRTGLPWQLFTSCPEVKAGMLSLGFTAPYL